MNIHEEKWNKQLGKLVQAITHIDTYFNEERGMWRVQGTLSPEYEGYIPECEVWNSIKGRVYTFWLKPPLETERSTVSNGRKVLVLTPPTETEKILASYEIESLWYALDDNALWYGAVEEGYPRLSYLHLTPEELAIVKQDYIQITSGVIATGSKYTVVVTVHTDSKKTTHEIKKVAAFHVNVSDIVNKAEEHYGAMATCVEAKIFLNWE